MIELPQPYVVPGGRFSEMYYWDSFFHCLGLKELGRFDAIKGIAENMAFLAEQFGYIPNGNRDFYLGRSQPPFFGKTIELVEELGVASSSEISRYYVALKKAYSFWLEKRTFILESGASKYALPFYSSDICEPRPESLREDLATAQGVSNPEDLFRNLRGAAESGWDFSSRWLVRSGDLSSARTSDLGAVDLSCLLFEEQAQLEARFGGQAFLSSGISLDSRRRAIQELLWDEKLGVFCDFDFRRQKTAGIKTAAAVFPLWSKVASAEQAGRVAHFLETELLQPGGLATSLERSGQQWDAPNGWAPLQWIASQALENYGFEDLAREIRLRWAATCERGFEREGCLREKYNVQDPTGAAQDGEYPNQPGFGWTNAIYLNFTS